MDAVSPRACASRVLETAPLVMQFIRTEMRRRRTRWVSVPQFRTLIYLERHPGGSPSDVAEWMGSSLPAVSRLVDGLFQRGLVAREGIAGDRRRTALRLTSRGRKLLQAAREGTQARLADALASLPADRRVVVLEAMDSLRSVFSGYQATDAREPR
jgi:DNA-binding MarR family transcriptional regulator